MKNKLLYIIIILLVIAGLCLKLTHQKNSLAESSTNTPYLDLSSEKCAPDNNVSDRYVCLYNLASTTLAQVSDLETKLITQAPIRLKEVEATTSGPVPFQYGGSDFLKDLPDVIKEAQKSRENYFDAVCGLDAMKIYGGSGMDLEKEACVYFYAKQYLQTLQDLEPSIK